MSTCTPVPPRATEKSSLFSPLPPAGVASMEMVECSLTATLAPRPLPGRVRNGPPRPAVLAAGRARLRVQSARREQPPPPEPVAVGSGSGTENGGRALGQAAGGLAAAAVVSLTAFAGDVSPLPTLPARAESLTVAFPVAKAREVGLDSDLRVVANKKEFSFMAILFVWVAGR